MGVYFDRRTHNTAAYCDAMANNNNDRRIQKKYVYEQGNLSRGQSKPESPREDAACFQLAQTYHVQQRMQKENNKKMDTTMSSTAPSFLIIELCVIWFSVASAAIHRLLADCVSTFRERKKKYL